MTDAFGPLYQDEPAPPPVAAVAIKAARAKLNAVRAPAPVWPLVGAAALCAGAALALAAAVILGPPNRPPGAPAPTLETPVR
jgi:hypothetical protein